MKNTMEYQKEVSKQASMTIGASYAGVSGAFTASSEYKKTEKIMESGERGFAEATAQCNLFKISYSMPPCLSPNLEAGLMMLSTNPSESSLNMFIDTFGTHALKQVNMGAKFVSTASFSKDQLDKYEKEDKTIKFSADVSAWVVSTKSSY